MAEPWAAAPGITSADADGPAGGRERFRALDGLRGCAAVIVLVHHVFLTQSSLARPFVTERSAGPDQSTFIQALTYSPLHLSWDGTEAVYVFFVLSGFVLTLPFDGVGRRRRGTWSSYFPRRLVRLYLPAWGGIALGTLLAAAVTRTSKPGASGWLNEHAGALSATGVLHAGVLLAGGGWLDSPLWSLRWEVAFSLLLPAFLWFGLTWRRGWAVKVVICLVLIATLGRYSPFLYLPMFAIGVSLAAGRSGLTALAGRVRGPVWAAVLVVSLLLINARWDWRGIQTGVGPILTTPVASTAGAAGLVVASLCWPAMGRLLGRPVVQWLGLVSFSLYVTHEPIVVSIALLLGGHANAAITLVVSALVCLPVAWGFYRVVESPAHRLSQVVGRRMLLHAQFPAVDSEPRMFPATTTDWSEATATARAPVGPQRVEALAIPDAWGRPSDTLALPRARETPHPPAGGERAPAEELDPVGSVSDGAGPTEDGPTSQSV